jgi:HEAT repeat protein
MDIILAILLAQDPAGLVERLGDPQPEIRADAESALRALGEKARPVLAQAAGNHKDAEVRIRASSLLLALDWEPLIPPYLDDQIPLRVPELTSSDPKKRRAGLRELQRQAPFRLDPLLTRFLDDPDSDVALYAALHLVEGSWIEIVGQRILRTQYRPACVGLLRLLSRWGELAGRRIPFDSRETLSSRESTETAEHVLDLILGNRYGGADRALRRSDWPILEKLSDHPLARVRALVARAAPTFGKQAQPTLDRDSRDPDESVREAARSSMARASDQTADWRLRLASEDPLDRILAAEELQRSGSKDGLEVLLKLVTHERQDLRARAAKVLVGFDDPRVPEAVAPVRDETLRRVDSLGGRDRTEALALLCAIGDGPSTEAMLRMTRRGARLRSNSAFVPATYLVRPSNIGAILRSVMEEQNEEMYRVLTETSVDRLHAAVLDEAPRVLEREKNPDWRIVVGRILSAQVEMIEGLGTTEQKAAARKRLEPTLRSILSDPRDEAYDAAADIARSLDFRDLAPVIAESLKTRHSPAAMCALADWNCREAAPVLRQIIEKYRGKESEAQYEERDPMRLGSRSAAPIVGYALLALRVLGGPEDVPAALRLLRQKDVMSSAANIIVKHGNESVRGPMRELLASNDRECVQSAGTLAARFATQEDLPAIRRALETFPSEDLVKAVARLKDRESIPRLRSLLERGALNRFALMSALHQAGDETVAHRVLDALSSRNKEEREEALEFIAFSGLRDAYARVKRLAASEWEYHWRVVRALAAAGGRDATEEVLGFLRDDAAPWSYAEFLSEHAPPQAIPVLMDQRRLQGEIIDRVVHAAFYRGRLQEFENLTIPESAASAATIAQRMFGVETDVSAERAAQRESGEGLPASGKGLAAFLSLVPGTEILRDGRIWFCTESEAEAYWREWWEKNRESFK